MDVTKEHINHILELREILLSFQTGFSLVNKLFHVKNKNEKALDFRLTKCTVIKIFHMNQTTEGKQNSLVLLGQIFSCGFIHDMNAHQGVKNVEVVF